MLIFFVFFTLVHSSVVCVDNPCMLCKSEVYILQINCWDFCLASSTIDSTMCIDIDSLRNSINSPHRLFYEKLHATIRPNTSSTEKINVLSSTMEQPQSFSLILTLQVFSSKIFFQAPFAQNAFFSLEFRENEVELRLNYTVHGEIQAFAVAYAINKGQWGQLKILISQGLDGLTVAFQSLNSYIPEVQLENFEKPMEWFIGEFESLNSLCMNLEECNPCVGNLNEKREIKCTEWNSLEELSASKELSVDGKITRKLTGPYTLDLCTLNNCPAGYEVSSTVCNLTSAIVMDLELNVIDILIQDAYSNVLSIYSGTPAPFRGYYFSMNDFAFTNSFLLSYAFTLQLWFKMIAQGDLLTLGMSMMVSSSTANTLNLLIGSDTFSINYSVSLWSVLIIKSYGASAQYSFQVYPDSTVDISHNSDTCEFLEGQIMLGYGFTGFIWRIQIFNGDYNLAEADLTVCTDAILTDCIWDCGITEYFNNGTCYNCSSSCTSCINQYDCNLCVNSICTDCVDYYECTDCIFNASLVNNVCECDPSFYVASTSTNEIICTEVRLCYTENTQVVDQCCFDECPTGYASSGKSCVLTRETIVDFNLNRTKTTSFQDANASTFSPNSAIPSPFRGYYFAPTANANIAAISLPYTFSIYIWIKNVASGLILTYDKLSLSSGTNSLTLLIDSNPYLATNFTTAWSIIMVKRLAISSSILISIYPDTVIYPYSDNKTCDSLSGIITFGYNGIAGFTGFIRRFIIYSGDYDITDSVVVCSAYILTDCLWDCDVTTYFNDTTCNNCESTCPTCANQYDCNLCVNATCTDCMDYYECTDCISDASIVNNVCECDPGFYLALTSTNETICTEVRLCYTEGTQVVDQCCFNECPTGYTSSGKYCLLTRETVLDFDFDVIKTTSFPDANANIFYPNSSIPSPFRGYYFDPTTNANITTISLSYTFSMYIWIKNVASGLILTYDKLSLSSGTNSLTLSIDSNPYLATSFTTAWSIIMVKRLASSSSILISIYPDTVIYSYSDNKACDSLSGILILGFNEIAGFTGFIWKFSIYNGDHDINESIVVCSADILTDCLWDCNVKTYFNNGTCSNCASACATCRNPYDCILCANSVCSGCTDYYKCTSCISTASIVNDVCECNSMYYAALKLDSVTICKQSGICITGDTRYTVGECCYNACPIGYTLSGSNCALTRTTAIDLQFNNLRQDHIDDIYGNSFFIGSPPYPYVNRGYYMYSGCYIGTYNTFLISHSTTHQVWLKIITPGYLYSFDNFKLTFDNTGVNAYIGPILSRFDTMTFDWTVLVFKRWTQAGTGYMSVQLYPSSEIIVSTEPIPCNFLSSAYHVGAGFTGFLWRWSLYNTIADISIDLVICNTNVTVDCLWSCNDGFYYNETEIACISGCSNCRRDYDCNVCANSLCTGCDYYYNCTTCTGNATLVNGLCECDYLFNAVLGYDTKTTCQQSGICIPGDTRYTVDECCYSGCPIGYTLSGSNCTLTRIPAIDWKFDNLKKSQINDIYGNALIPNLTPVPYVQRGYYMYPDFYFANSAFLISHSTTHHIWLKIITAGFLYSINNFKLTFDSTGVNVYIGSVIYRFNTMTFDWTVLVFKRWTQADTGYLSVQMYPSSEIIALTETESCNFLIGTYYIGKGFVGFLWGWSLYNTIEDIAIDLAVCNTNVAVDCVWNSNLGFYFNETNLPCIIGCPNCRRSYDCNVCVNSLCTDCDYYSTCKTCVENATLVDELCVCKDYYFETFNDTGVPICLSCNENCRSTCTGSLPCDCDSLSTKYNVLLCCSDLCPFGFSPNGDFCDLVNTTIFDFDFNRVEYNSWTDIYGNTMYIDIPGAIYTNDMYARPVPSYARGYYFSDIAFAETSNIELLYTFTINLWVKLLGKGTIFSLDDLVVTAKDSELAVVTNGGSFSFDVVYNEWRVLILQQWQKNITRYFQASFYPDVSVNQTGSIVCHFMSGKITLGSTSNGSGFTGFIWQMQIYNGIYEFSGNFSVCGTDIDCLWDCNVTEHFNTSSCIACSDSCSSCRNSDDCNLCYNSFCTDCEVYETCTSCTIHASLMAGICECNFMYFGVLQSPGVATCEGCHSTCFDDCVGEKPCQCNSVTFATKLNVEECCYTSCPFGYLEVGNDCELISEQIMQFTFTEFSTETDTYGNDLSSYNTITTPFRGYYYSDGSYSETNSVTLLYTFTVQMWAKFYTFGEVISIGRFTYTIDSISTTLAIGLSSYTIDYISTGWSLIILKRWIDISTSYLSLQYFPNVLIMTQTEVSICDFFEGPLKINSISSPFTGFLWRLNIYNHIADINPDFSICTSIITDNCIWDCDLPQYFDGSTCENCTIGCETCKNPVNCNICKSPLCTSCTDLNTCTNCTDVAEMIDSVCSCNITTYLDLVNSTYNCVPCLSECSSCTNGTSCLTCGSGAVPKLNGCICEDNQYVNILNMCEDCGSSCKYCNGSTFYSCTSCENLFLLQGVCLKLCPIGYLADDGNCTAIVKYLVMDYIFTSISGVFYDSVFGIPALTGTSSQYYPELESTDPVPAYGRGIYFTGSAYLSLPNPMDHFLMLGFKFYTELWVNIEKPGCVIDKTDTDGTLLSLIINTKIEVQIRVNSIVYNYFCANTVQLAQWTHVIIALEYPLTQIYCYFNSIKTQTFTVDEGPFIDTINNVMVIGKSNFGFYTGFLYKLSFYLNLPETNGLVTTSCDSCEVCIPSAGCLPLCSIDEYMLDTCQSCMENCTSGCVRGTDCNLCADVNCNTCSGFYQHSCSKCSGKYVLSNSDCNNCTDTQYFDEATNGCKNCESPCIQCIDEKTCKVCIGNSTLADGKCACGQGYSLTYTCLRNYFSVAPAINEANEVTLFFTEELLAKLLIPDLQVAVESTILTFTILQVTNAQWKITPNYLIDSDGTNLILITFLTPIVSIKNSLLYQTSVSITLFPNKLNSVSQAVQNIVGAATSIIATAIATSLGASAIMINPSSLFSFLQILEIYNYIPLYQANLSPSILQLLNSFNVDKLTPNIMTYIVPEKYGANVTEKFSEFGINSNLFLINAGIYISGTIVLIISWVPAFFIHKFCHPWIRNKFNGVYKNYRYNYFTRMWVQCYLDLLIYAGIAILHSDTKNTVQIIDLAISVLTIIGQIYGVILLVKIIVNKSRQNVPDEVFDKKWNTFFEGCDEKAESNIYYLLYLFRRTMLATIILFITNPFLQLTISITLTLIVFFIQIPIYLFTTGIIVSKLMRWYMIFNDVLIVLFYYFILSDLIYLKTSMSTEVEAKCIAIILTAIGSNILLSFVQSILQIVRIIKALKERWRLKKIQPELNITTTLEHEQQQPQPHFKTMRNTYKHKTKATIEEAKQRKSFREIEDI